MNKIKILLTAITVFAVVGGALAFKASKIHTIYCSEVASQEPNCAPFAATLIDNGRDPLGQSFCTDNPDADCLVKTTTYFSE